MSHPWSAALRVTLRVTLTQGVNLTFDAKHSRKPKGHERGRSAMKSPATAFGIISAACGIHHSEYLNLSVAGAA